MNQLSESDARKFVRAVHLLVGPVDYAKLPLPAMDQRVRGRYKKEIAELSDLGFEYLCSEGQAFPLSRFFRILPAIASFEAWRRGVPIWIKGGSILFGYPILCWRHEPSFVELDGSQAKFISAFEDGSLLVSGNYDYPIPPTANILRQFKAATLAETWHAHRTRVEALEAVGKQIDPRSDYGIYLKAAALERAA